MKSSNRKRALPLFLLVALIAVADGCGEKGKESSPTMDVGGVLYLSRARFKQEEGADGKSEWVTCPARLEIWSKTEDGWQSEVLEDPESNVFHKAVWYTPPEGEPGILTIGAEEALLKIWRRGEDGWIAETLWNPSFGGEYDRLRDFEVADVTGNGVDDIAIATHDQGVVALLTWAGGEWHAEELIRKENTFVHEIEAGDVDGDGAFELFTTPSMPNKLDGSVQSGEIDRFDYREGKCVQEQVGDLKTRHAKEILCAVLTGEERPVLFVSLEGERIGGGKENGGDTTRIRLYRFHEDGIVESDIASFPGRLCRFLTLGDTDGDGVAELIASTRKSGIWKLTPPKDGAEVWDKVLVATGSSSFEHATFLYDFNGDGVKEIYVASDDQEELRCYRWNGSGYSKEVIGPLLGECITFNITAQMFNE